MAGSGWSCGLGLGLMNKLLSRWLAAAESRTVVEGEVEGEVEVDVEVLLFRGSVEGVDGVLVEVLLSGGRSIMGGIAVTVGLSVLNLRGVSVKIVPALYK